jgi:hypothetical protein
MAGSSPAMRGIEIAHKAFPLAAMRRICQDRLLEGLNKSWG